MEILIDSSTIDNFCMMLEKSLDRFIDYALDHSCKVRNYEYINRVWIAWWLRDNYQTEVALHILNFAIYEKKYFLTTRHIFPQETLEFIKTIQFYVFNDSLKETDPNDLSYQNGLSSAYEPFDFSVSNVTTIEKAGL